MLNVICKNPSDRRDYLDQCLRSCEQFQLSEVEKSFICNSLLMIAGYMDNALKEDDINAIGMAQLLFYYGDKLENSTLLILIETLYYGESLSPSWKRILGYYIYKAKSLYTTDRLTLLFQVLLADAMLNATTNRIILNTLNLCLLKSQLGDSAPLNQLFVVATSSCYASPVFKEFSGHYEALLKNDNTDYDDLMSYVQQKYELIPEKIRKKLEEYVFSIHLSPRLDCKDKTRRKLGSTHICGDNIRIWLEADKNIIDATFYHEIGHAVDKAYGEEKRYSQESSAWDNAFNEDRDVFYSYKAKENQDLQEIHEYSTTNPSEYFAGAFVEYIQSPEQLRKYCPNTYCCLNNLLQIFQ